MVTLSKQGADVAVQCWRLDAGERTALLASFNNGVPALVYFDQTLPSNENLETLARLTVPNVTGGQLDPIVPLTLVPTPMDGWQGNPGVKLAGELAPSLSLRAAPVTTDTNRFAATLSGAAEIALSVFLCPQTSLLQVVILPESKKLDWLAASVPVADKCTRIIDHGGRWCGEFQHQERRFATGQYVRESQEGRAGHGHFPGIIFAADSCDENIGLCMGVAMHWSGGHRVVAEETPDGRRHVQFGFSDSDSTYPREIWLGVSRTGFNGLSQAMQAHVRSSLPKRASRPVHYNCWEAVYFRHSVDELKEIATKAHALGAERFVLDDGWFKGRHNDTTSLGDWGVDPDKYPDGLTPLTDHVIALGMEFGIWFEPEMVNIDSDLYRAHPDWVLGPEEQPSGRQQFVLDLMKPQVTSYLFETISAIVKAYPVSYIKWDHNRILTGGQSGQTEALYDLLARLNRAFPDVDIESCASGGGRIDYGMLQHTTRVWLSDSNDALERLKMQHEASRWLPPEVQGSHVGPRVCHTSGRVLPMAFRAWVAANRHMGFEMDPREVTDDEATTLKQITQWYKDNRAFMASADNFRLDSVDPECVAELFVAKDKSQFIAFIGQMGASSQIASRPLCFSGLDDGALYTLELLEPAAIPANLNRNSGLAALSVLSLSGAALMNGAFHPPNLFPASMLVYRGKKQEQNS